FEAPVAVAEPEPELLVLPEAPVAAPAPAPVAQFGETVRIAPAAPRFVPAPEPVQEMAPVAEPVMRHDEPFIPPAAERNVVRPVRMPRVEELPMPAQAQIAQTRSTPAAPPAPVSADSKRLSLMQRLAAVGFGRKDEAPAPVAAKPAMPTPPAPAPSAAHSEYMRRPVQAQPKVAQGQLDQHGRGAPQRSFEDDQLEIPAFLRRQAN
ncbi:MAG: cell division protein FtsZ, partial [Bosea sp. (in: a-proteobacteria)]